MSGRASSKEISLDGHFYLLAELTSNVKLAIFECYSLLAPAQPMNDARNTNIVGVDQTTYGKLHINVSQSSRCAKMAFQKRLEVPAFRAFIL